MPRRSIPIEERLWAKVKRGRVNECWEWQGFRNSFGYGLLRRGPAPAGKVRAHRVAWESVNGPIPNNMVVCHRCDNPPCCNPRHLFLGTHSDNMADMAKKGRGHGGRKLSAEDVAAIRREHAALKYGEKMPAVYALADRYGITWEHVYAIVGRRAWAK